MKNILLLITLMFGVIDSYAADKYWVCGNNWWDDASCWSLTEGGAGNAGQPMAGDAIFLSQSDGLTRTVNYRNSLNPDDLLTSLLVDATGGGTITLSQTQDRLVSGVEFIGFNGAGIFNQSGGANEVTELLLGRYTNSYGTYSLSDTGSLLVDTLRVGVNGTGVFNQTGGTNTVSISLSLGQGAGSQGTYNLSGSGVLSAPVESIASSYGQLSNVTAGLFNHSSGINTITDHLSIGGNIGGFSGDTNGRYNLSGTGQLSSVNEYIGVNGGIGLLDQTGGTNTVSSNLFLGYELELVYFPSYESNGVGTYRLSGDGSLSVGGDEYVGFDGTAVFEQSGGTHTVTNRLYLAEQTGGRGTYYLSGTGTLSVGLNEMIGKSGVGVFNQTGGTNSTSSLTLGQTSGASGTYYLSGTGTLNSSSQVIGVLGSGEFHQSGGSNTVTSILYLGFEIGSVGTYNLSGTGLLSATDEYVGRLGTGTFNQDGGNHTVSGTMTITGPSGVSAYNLSGGTLDADTINASSGGKFNFGGGSLSVNTFNGDLQNNGGTLAPGSSLGSTIIVGDYSQDIDSTLSIEVGGLLAGQEYDVLNVTGTATLDGTLNVSLFDTGSGLFSPQLGDNFDILTADLLQGSFSSLLLAVLDPGLKWDIGYLTDAIGTTDVVRLSVAQAVVPVPPAVWLFGSGLLALVGVAKRRDRITSH